MGSRERVLGVLAILLLSSGAVYVTLTTEDVRVRVDEDRSTLYTIEEGRWTVLAREQVKVYDGSSLLYRKRAGISVTEHENTTHFMVRRHTPYYRGPVIIEEWAFGKEESDVLRFPVSHTIMALNATGYIVQWEVREADHTGETLKNVRSPFVFNASPEQDRLVRIEWDEKSYWNTVYKSGIFKARWRPESSTEVYRARLYDPLNDGGLHDTAELLKNTEQCLGTYCEAIFVLNTTASEKQLQRNINLSITFEDKEGNEIPVGFSTEYEVGWPATREVVVTGWVNTHNETDPNNGTVTLIHEPFNTTVNESYINWTGKKKAIPGQNYIRIWTNDFNEDWVDWHVLIKNWPVEVGGIRKDVDFDTHRKGWAVWATQDYPWQNDSFDNRRNMTIDDAGRTNTPVRVNLSSINANSDSTFAVYDENNNSKPFSYLDANEHITDLRSNSSYLLFTANSSEYYFIYYNNNTPVTKGADAFLLWDRFINNSNNLPWDLRGGTFDFSNGYAATVSDPAHMTHDITGMYDYKDLGIFGRTYMDVRGDDSRFAIRDNTDANLATTGDKLLCDHGPTTLRCFYAGGGPDTGGTALSLDTWHDVTWRMGTTQLAIWVDEATSPSDDKVAPTDAQMGLIANNRTGWGGQEQGEGRLDDYALWDWTVLGRVLFYDNLTTSYTMGSEMDAPVEAAGIAWVQNLTNQTINHNTTFYLDANATNQSTEIAVHNYTINDSTFTMNNVTGIINQGLTISDVGFYHVSIRAYDNQTTPEYIEQNITINVTNACAYDGTGDYWADLNGQCEIGTTVTVEGTCYFFNTGSFVINQTGILSCNMTRYEPESLDGSSTIAVLTGGSFTPTKIGG